MPKLKKMWSLFQKIFIISYCWFFGDPRYMFFCFLLMGRADDQLLTVFLDCLLPQPGLWSQYPWQNSMRHWHHDIFGCPFPLNATGRVTNFLLCVEYIFFYFLRNFFLCQDRWHGDVPPHLAQPCYVALGQALDWGLISRHVFRALSIGFLFPISSRIHWSKEWFYSCPACIVQSSTARPY